MSKKINKVKFKEISELSVMYLVIGGLFSNIIIWFMGFGLIISWCKDYFLNK